MKIRILQIGKNKDKYLQEGVKKFLKMISPFADIKIVDLKEIPASATFTKDKCVVEEGEEILKSISEDESLFTLDEKGKEYDSIEFSQFLKKHKDFGQKICFVIGGRYGLSEEVKKKANRIISFSKMTFTHQMIRLFLLEQIYRGLSIIHGKRYHN